MNSLSLGAVCPEHPDQAAVATCARCGRYVCAGCQGGEDRCPACRLMTLQGLPSSRARSRTAVGFLWTCVIVYALSLLDSVWALQTRADTSGAGALWELLLGLGTFVGLIGSAIAFLMWLHLAVRQTLALGYYVGATPGGAVGWWFMPFANLVRPFRVVHRMVLGLGGESLDASLSLRLWWGTWVASNILTNLEARMENQVPLIHWVSIANSVCTLVAGYLCARMVSEVQLRLDALRDGPG